MDNLCFNREGYLSFVLTMLYLIIEIKNILPRVPILYRNTRGSLGFRLI